MNKKASLETGQKLLEETGFGPFLAELFRPGSPLAFLTAQGLRVAQPVLGAFTTPAGLNSLEAWATHLEAAPFGDTAETEE